MKDSIRKPDGTPRFPPRLVEAIEVTYSEEDRQIHRLLKAFTDGRRSRAKSGARRNAVDIATLLLKKRLFSSPMAFATTIARYGDTLRHQKRSEEPAPWTTAPTWLAELELAGQDEVDDEVKSEAEQDQLARAAEYDVVLTGEEDQLLSEMLDWARLHGDRPDAKARQLIAYLTNTCRPAGGWNNERVVVFTEYRDTQKWLAELLVANGLGGEGLQLLYGGQDEKEREHIKNAFQAEPWRAPVRILLATDAAGEGIDLQLHCHRVVNYDIPFNPNRLEQRIGRIDRHGQRYQPEAYHFVGSGWKATEAGSFERDLEFLARVARKISAQAEDLGSINSVLQLAIQRHMVGEDVQVDPLTVTSKPASRALRAERDLRERVPLLAQKLRASIEELHITPKNVERVVNTALSLARQPALLPVQDKKDATDGFYRLPVLSGSWSRAARGLEDPLSGDLRPITFDQDRIAGRLDVVLAHLGHPLVAMSAGLLRAAVWGTQQTDLHRVSACLSSDPSLEGVVLAAYSRLLLIGADGSRLHEEVFPTGGWLRNGRFAAIPTGKLREILDGALAIGSTRAVPARLRASLADQWPRSQAALGTAISNRAAERESSLGKRLANLRTSEISRLNNVLEQFRRTLEQAITEPATEQLELQLTDPDERAQLRRDVDAWRATLASLESQRQGEIELINRRYADVRPLTFPAAIVFVVPERDAA